MKMICVPLVCFVILCSVFSNAKAQILYQCQSKLYDIDSVTTQITKLAEYCKGKTCLPKCCKRNEILIKKQPLLPSCGDPKSYNLTINDDKYNKLIPIYKTSETESSVTNITTKYKFLDFPLVINKLTNESCGESLGEQFIIQENGDAMYDFTDSIGSWLKIDPAHYCVDILYEKQESIKATILYSKEKADEDQETILKYSAGMSLISSFFLVLTFAVYCVLPQLRTMPGLLQMTYVAALFLTFLTRAVLSLGSGGETYCFTISTLFYFSLLSSFFWLTIMSFDIWWTFRAQRYKRPIHRRGILTKFGWYCLGGCGLPLLMTIVGIIIDYNQASLAPTIAIPHFKDCLNGGGLIYASIPIGIMTFINILLFTMTLYNIWLINKEIDKMGSNTKNNNRFIIFTKLSLMMGVSWILELAPKFFDERFIPTWFNILISFYNFLMGLVIFIIFICNKTTLRILCKRFSIKSRWLRQELSVNPGSRSTATKSSVHTGSYHRTRSTADSDLEMEDIHDVSTSPATETKL